VSDERGSPEGVEIEALPGVLLLEGLLPEGRGELHAIEPRA
jgi:hypothetical protein